ncbi:DUF3240 family protein [Ferrovibrio sp.]|uniref:DUF3240 family protein n=1 Tax=Ferrovibrio sp. TaxID=1917215 RepID=UPI003516886E
MSNQNVRLTFTAAKAFEEKLIDTLLADENASAAGFSTRDVNVYGAHITYRTAMEQVHGRVRAVEVSLVLPQPHAKAALESVRQALSGRDVVYRISTISDSGEV